MNRMLLRESRKESKRLKYEFPGYTVNGQVQVKKSKSSKYIPINRKQDLVKRNPNYYIPYMDMVKNIGHNVGIL